MTCEKFEQVKTFESGNEMAAMAAAQINYHLMGYFPITPSTEVAQYLDAMKTRGEHEIQLIAADGEHGSAGICYGAAVAGARVINATSANGLLYMIEQLPVQSGTRISVRCEEDAGLPVQRSLFSYCHESPKQPPHIPVGLVSLTLL